MHAGVRTRDARRVRTRDARIPEASISEASVARPISQRLRVRSVSHSATCARDADTDSSNCTLLFLTPCRNISAKSKVVKERQPRLARMPVLELCCSTVAVTTRNGSAPESIWEQG